MPTNPLPRKSKVKKIANPSTITIPLKATVSLPVWAIAKPIATTKPSAANSAVKPLRSFGMTKFTNRSTQAQAITILICMIADRLEARLSRVISSLSLWQSHHCCTLQGRHQLIHGGSHQIKERRRIQANPEDEDQQRHKSDNFSPVQIEQFTILVFIQRPKEHLLKHVEHVDFRQDHSHRCQASVPGRSDRLGAKRAQQDGELAYKPVQSRQAHRRQGYDQGQGSVDWHHLPQTAKSVHIARVAALVDHAHDQEQRPSAEAVVDHLQDAT